MNTIPSISVCAHGENWSSHQQIGAIAQDSANISSGIEHDYVANIIFTMDISRQFSDWNAYVFLEVDQHLDQMYPQSQLASTKCRTRLCTCLLTLQTYDGWTG